MKINIKILILPVLVFCALSSFAQNAGFSATTATEGCAPLVVQFRSNEQSTAYTHTWDFGNGQVNNGPINPSRSYTATGTYTVVHTISGPGGTKTETKTAYITVHASPTVSFTATPTSGCPPLNVTFNNTSTPGVTGAFTSYWVMGVGTTPGTSNAKNPSATYTSGPNNVTLTVTNSKGCKMSLTKTAYINVLPEPSIQFSANKENFCSAPAAANFTSTVAGASGPYTYAWTFGGSTANPSHNFPGPAPIQHTVGVTVTAANGCKATTTKPGYIKIHDAKASFTGPSQICVFATAHFKNTSVINGATYTWDWGDGKSSAGTPDGAHIYTTPGTYTIKLTTNIGGCTAQATKSITVLPQPNITINQNPTDPCPAPQTITFSTTPAMSSYLWRIYDHGGPTNYTSATPSHTYTENGSFPVVLEVADNNGCKDTVKLEDLVKVEMYPLYLVSKVNGNDALPLPYISDSGCVPLQVKFGTKAVIDTITEVGYPHGVASYKWTFDDGSTSTLQAPVHTYTDSGDFIVTVDVTTTNGCVVSDTMLIRVGYKPVSDFTATPRVACPKQQVTFTATSTGYDTLIYKWFFGDGGEDFQVHNRTTEYKYNCLGLYDVTLITSHKGCKDTMVKEKYIEVLPPCAIIDTVIDCDKPLQVQFLNKSNGDSSHIWIFGDGNTSTLDNPLHTYATAGMYNVLLAVYNSTTNCRDTMDLWIYVGENPPNVTVNQTEFCEGDTADFHAFLTNNTNVYSYFVYIINGSIVSTGPADYSHEFTTRGVYSVTVVSIDHQDCRDTVVKNNWITVGRPDVGFITDTTFTCEPGPIEFTDTSKGVPSTRSIVSRYWDFGSGTPSTLTTTNTKVTQVYPQRGDFRVALVVTDNIGCKDSLILNPYIHVLKPVAKYTAPIDACVGEKIDFEDLSDNGVTYKWEFGDGNTLTYTGPSDTTHTYTSVGTFDTKLTLTDSMGCMDTSTILKITTTKPTPDFTMSDSMSVCPPFVVQFDGTVSIGAQRYEWHFDNGSGKGGRPQHTVVFNDIKEYKIKLIVTDVNGCKDSIVKTAQVLGYAGAMKYPVKEGCAPLTVTFNLDIKGKVPTMIWDFGDGNTLLGNHLQPQVTYTYNTPGKYLPKMVFNNGLGCSASSDGLDTIIVDAAIADFDTGPACQYSKVDFINKSTSIDGAITINDWDFHDGSFSALKDPSRNYGPPGKYNVKLRVSNSRGCEDSLEKEITINVPIEVNAGADTVICLTDSVMLMPSGGVSYEWTPGTTLSCTNCNNPFAFPTDKTIYTVISTDVNGCHDTAEVEVDIKTHVTSSVGAGGEICEGEEFALSVTGGTSYLWIPSNSVDNPNSGTPIATPTTTTKYHVVAYEGSCIPDTNTVDITVFPKPTVSIRGGGQIVAGTTADLIASGDNIVRFLWSPANTLSCSDCSDPVASPFKTTKYQVKVFTKYECVDSADVTISVLCDEKQLFIPNTFTPNGDGINDIFRVRGNGISTLKSFRVYNRWGQVLFERTDATVNDNANGWDGTHNGVQLPPDVYIYIVEAFCENGELLKLKGDVTIIR